MATKEAVVDLNRLWAIRGVVVHGHGRGGTQLGFPTANVGLDAATTAALLEFQNWVYYGWGLVEPKEKKSSDPSSSSDPAVTAASLVPIVMSVGFNPHFQDKSLTLEAHFLKKFDEDFYDHTVRIVSCGALREQASFKSLEALIEAIKNDCRVADEKLQLGEGVKLRTSSFWTDLRDGAGVPYFTLLETPSSL